MFEIVKLIKDANPNRSNANIIRRCWNVIEEHGEVAEAYRSATCQFNGKNKTWDDVREEIVDVLIVVTDIALTPLPDNLGNAFADTLPRIRTTATERTQHKRLVSEIGFHIASFAMEYGNGQFGIARNHILTAFNLASDLAHIPLPDRPTDNIQNIKKLLEKEGVRKLKNGILTALKWKS